MKLVRFMAMSLMCLGAASMLAPSQASAQSFGSWGGSSGGGSFGSSGGSFGSSGGSSGGRAGLFGGSNGGPIRNLLGRVQSHISSHHGSSGGMSRGSSGGSSGGSWGSRFGSRGGSSGGVVSSYSYGSSGGSSGGSRGSWSSSYSGSGSWGGSSGGTAVYYGQDSGYQVGGDVMSAPDYGTTYGMPVDGSNVVTPTNSYYDASGSGNAVSPQPSSLGPIPSPSESQKPPVPPTEDGAEAAADGVDTVLNIELPEDALVYVNGRPTRSTGAQRSFVARRLVPGRAYTFEVKAVLYQGAQESAQDQLVTVIAGEAKTVSFEFAPAAITTTVAVQVPADAKITLAGVETSETGGTRVFSTNTLESGKSWKNYTVVATIERDGKTITREHTLDVEAGKTHQIKFDFEGSDTRVASR